MIGEFWINGALVRYCGGEMDCVGRCLRCGALVTSSAGCTRYYPVERKEASDAEA